VTSYCDYDHAELKGGPGTTWITDFSVDLTTSAE